MSQNKPNNSNTPNLGEVSGDSVASSSIVVEDWEDLGSSSASSISANRATGFQSTGQNTSSTLGSTDSDVITSGTSASSASEPSPYADELERLLMEAQKDGGSSRGTSIRSSSGPISPVWSTGGGTGFSSPVFLQNSANQTKLEAALANYSSRPECTPLKPHELAEKFRHPNGNGGGGDGLLTVSGMEQRQHDSNLNYPVSTSDDISDYGSNEDWLSRLSSSVRTMMAPPYSYLLIPTHLLMFGLGALCAYICYAKKVFNRWR
ncbi:uncharacterized protein LOC134856492 [Symsagittifera roscoffensis]|uniref:uncharacterized protein LOC134856492 n=1 Tax=Symsagittifera roscoffensis TaxID=84072 RepID=UPI00307C9E4E